MVSGAVVGGDSTGSFLERFKLPGNSSGPLAGLTVAVKDLFDVKGHVTSMGSPAWLQEHPRQAPAHAAAVQALLDAGAHVVGKAHLPELAYSLDGSNPHYGTPKNVAAPGRLPGGSSSGSAAAVAAGQADIGLGSDTGGSVRVPASYCGLYGIRPTHGRVSLAGATALAPSYDTAGWLTRDAGLLQQVGSVLLPKAFTKPLPGSPRWLVAQDAFGLADPGAGQAIYDALAGAAFEKVTGVLGQPKELKVTEGLEPAGLGQLSDWAEVFRITQAYEVWQEHGAWVRRACPTFGPGIQERFDMAASITEQQWQEANSKRDRIRQHLTQLLGQDGVLAVPSAPGSAPLVDSSPSELDAWRKRLLPLTCIAGLAGLPQVSIPVARIDGLPVGLGLIGPHGSDEALLQLAVQLAEQGIPAAPSS